MSRPTYTPRASSTTYLTSSTPHLAYSDTRRSGHSDAASIGLISRLNTSFKESDLKSGLGRDYWLDDASATKCRDCDRKFTTFLRKHHCRICGKIFCHNCTRFIEGDKFNHRGKMRVCFFCANKLERYENYNSSDEDVDDSVMYNHISPGNSGASNSSFHGSSFAPRRSLTEKSLSNMKLDGENIPKLHHMKIRQAASKSPALLGNSGSSTNSDTDNDVDNQGSNSDDEENQGMITLMNNHEFNWPSGDTDFLRKFSNVNAMNNSKGIFDSNSSKFHKDRLKLHRLQGKHLSHPTSSNGGNNNRRRNFSSRYSKPNRITSLSSNFKMIQLKSDIHFMDDLQKKSESYNKLLLKELLNDKQVPNVDSWADILLKSLKKINNVEIGLNKGTDGTSYAFADYIKIKKIPGGKFSESTTIEGLVFSKKLPLKNMPLNIENPRIMIITFAIEYDQNVNGEAHFQSLDSVIAQEDEYLKKLVDRIIQLKPSLIISNNSINGLALKFLSDSGIAAAPNCKNNILMKLARFTDATIITSIDMLARNPDLGKCEKFEQKYFVCDNYLRSYFFFTGCNPKMGLSLIIRGSDMDILKKVKTCLTPMIYAFVNTELESSFLRDKYLKLDEKGSNQTNIELTAPLYTIKLENFDDIVQLVKNRLISISPWVKFEEPQILVQMKTTISLLDDLKSNYLEFNNDTNKWGNLKKYKEKFNIINLNIEIESDMIKVVKAKREYLFNYWNSELSFHYRKWAQFWAARDFTYFDPNYNQNIAILFSIISSKNSTPCVGPKIQMIDFYWDGDESIGQYIERTCLQSDEVCVNGCELTLREHYKSYVHHNGKVDVSIENNSHSSVKSNSITTWSVCKQCEKSTNQMPLNDLSYKYSFGKFLELVFWYDNSLLKLGNLPCECPNSADIFKNYIHYFSYNEFIIKFEYSKIDSLQLVTPKFKLFWNPVYDFKIKVDYYNHVKNKSKQFFDSVESRLMIINLDETYVDDDLFERGKAKLKQLKTLLLKNRESIQELLQNIYVGSEVNEHLKLNVVLREVQELSSFWKLEFDDFEKQFLPTVKDMKSNFQLERLLNVLLNKDNEEEKIKDEADNETEVSETIDNEEKVTDDSKPLKKKSELILNKINELNDKFEAKAKYDFNYNDLERLDIGQVKRLKQLFETNTQDFFNEREKMEKRKLKSANNYLPKVGTMNPQVEIYKNARDATLDESRAQTANSKVEETDNENVVTNDVSKENEKKEKFKDEKSWFFKIMNNFIDTRTSTSWADLSYPLGPLEHIFVDSDVVVREDEPSSIISFCLSTKDYESKLYATYKESDKNDNKKAEQKATLTKENTEKEEQKDKVKSEMDDTYLKSILLKSGFHLNYQFEGGNSSSLIMCRIFFAEQFDALRRKCGVNDNFISSISRCIKWNSTGGKSGAAFLKTLDDRFIIKELSKSEIEAFTQMAHNYFEYFEQVLFNGLPSVIAKIFGLYQIQVKSSSTKSYTIDVVIMENLFYNRKPDRIFDLKGSMRNRHVEQTGKANEVLLDENMVEYIYESPVFVRENDKKLLRASLWNDTLFLEKMNVMDYSLVVGIDSNNKELVVGIIDCIRTFTWDKKLESWVKEKGLVGGGGGVGKEPTVITPKQYKNRFREAMERYILLAPGVYYQGTKTG